MQPNKPIPDDLVPILAKDESRQRQIMEKAKLDASSAEARSIGPSTPTQASRGLAKVAAAAAAAHKGAVAAAAKVPTGAPGAAAGKPPSQTLAGKGGAGAAAAAKPAPTVKPAVSAASPAPGAPKKISMVIQSIPPFRGGSAGSATKAAPGAAPPARQGSNGANPAPLNLNTAAAAAIRSPQATPMSPNTLAAKQLNAHASSFRPNPKANAFTPVIFDLLLLTVTSVL